MTRLPEQVTIADQKLTAELKGEYLRIALAGPFNVTQVGAVASQILKFCGDYKTAKILVDVLGLTGNPNIMERFTLASVFATKYVLAVTLGRIKPCRFAVIGKDPMVDSNKFEENVAVNRGTPVKTFTDLNQALLWLGVEKDEAKPIND